VDSILARLASVCCHAFDTTATFVATTAQRWQSSPAMGRTAGKLIQFTDLQSGRTTETGHLLSGWIRDAVPLSAHVPGARIQFHGTRLSVPSPSLQSFPGQAGRRSHPAIRQDHSGDAGSASFSGCRSCSTARKRAGRIATSTHARRATSETGERAAFSRRRASRRSLPIRSASAFRARMEWCRSAAGCSHWASSTTTTKK
jgi:hypothetical protein